MNLEDRVSLYYTALTKTEKKVYQAVLKNPDYIRNHSIQETAKYLKVSVASIQRFISKIGYSGFPEFKLDLKNKAVNKSNNKSYISSKNLIIEAYIRSLKLLETIDLNNFIKPLVKDLHVYENVKSIGNGNTALSAKQLAYSLYSEEKFIDTVDTTIKIDYLVNGLKKDNLLIIFSVTGAVDTYQDLLESAKKVGAKTYLITMNQESKLLNLADYKIVLPSTHVENSDNSLHRVDTRVVLYAFAELLSYYYAESKK